jgi:hypothetical protein
MINIFKFVSLFAYTILVFFFSGYRLAAFAVFNGIAMIVARVSPVQALKYLAGLLPFIGFVCVFNLVLGHAGDAVNLALRLVLIGNMTQCYKKNDKRRRFVRRHRNAVFSPAGIQN